jgi:bifunctional DNA-binding transcriptional regulator/antitoxin component of YhaV-PrlF toxin-antitoxin module
MPRKVKERSGPRGTGRVAGRSRISSKHQVTIPVGAFREAGLHEGDVVHIQVQGSGRILLTRLDDLIDRYAGALSTGGELGRTVRAVRDEWD